MADVLLKRGTSEEFATIETFVDGCIYFCTDTGDLYIGVKPSEEESSVTPVLIGKDQAEGLLGAIQLINDETNGILAQAKAYADGLANNYAPTTHTHTSSQITDLQEITSTEIADLFKDE